MSKNTTNQDIASSLANSEAFLTNLIYCTEYDSFYLWKDYYFRLLDGVPLKKELHLYMARTFATKNINDALVTDIMKSVRYYVNIVRDLPDFSRVAFNDKTLNLETFEWEEHSKQNLTVFNIDYNSTDLDMPTPEWDKFLSTSLVIEDTKIPDQDLIGFVQEMFGYFLLPSLKGSSAFFLVGGGSNGKSVMVKVIEEMFGKEYCSSMSIQKLTTNNWATAHLRGKKINISNEDESKFMKADVFKALVTGDTINAERKYGDPFEFTPNTKFVFCTNEMPTFDIMNHGLKRRMKFIPFFRKFHDHEQDKELQTKLSKEIPGIIKWSLEGARRFIANDRVFNQAQASIDSLNKFVLEISSALSFFNEFYIIDNDYKTANCDVYKDYTTWCINNGRKPMNSLNFWKELSKEYGSQLKICKAISREGQRTSGKNIVQKPDIDIDNGNIMEPVQEELEF